MTASSSDSNKTTNVTIEGNNGKTLVITAYITEKPAKTSQEFAEMIKTQIGTAKNGKNLTGDAELAKFFNKTINTIDSTSVTGLRTAAIKDIFGEDNLKGFSYAWYRLNKGTNNEQTVLLYAPIDMSNSVVEDPAKFAKSFNEVTQYIAVDCYVNDDTSSPATIMMPIKTQTLDGKAYVIFDISNTTINAPKEPAKEEGMTVTFEVDDAYKADYDLTGQMYKGDVCSVVWVNNRITSFGAVLKNKDGKRLDGVIMTLANDVSGTKTDYRGETTYNYPAGTQISHLENDGKGKLSAKVVYGNSASAADQFGFVTFASGTNMHIMVRPAMFNVNVYDAEGNLDSTKSGTVVEQDTFASPTETAKTEDATFTYQFLGYSETQDGTEFTSEELAARLTNIVSDINLYPVFQATRKPVATTPVTPETPATPEEPATPVTPVIPTTVVPLLVAAPTVNTVQNPNVVNVVADADNQGADNDVLIDEEQVPLSPQIEEPKETTDIEEAEVPLAAPEHDCFIHWILLIITLLYTVYTSIRTYQRKKEQNA